MDWTWKWHLSPSPVTMCQLESYFSWMNQKSFQFQKKSWWWLWNGANENGDGDGDGCPVTITHSSVPFLSDFADLTCFQFQWTELKHPFIHSYKVEQRRRTRHTNLLWISKEWREKFLYKSCLWQEWGTLSVTIWEWQGHILLVIINVL